MENAACRNRAGCMSVLSHYRVYLKKNFGTTKIVLRRIHRIAGVENQSVFKIDTNQLKQPRLTAEADIE